MIRNYVMVIALAIMGISNGFSQKISDENKYEFGLRIAPNISWVTPDSKSIDANGISLDWNYGFTVSRYINERYAFGTEINVVNVTSKFKYDKVYLAKSDNSSKGFANDLSMTYNLRYLQIPILFKMRTNAINGSKLRVFGEFGMGLGLLIRSKIDVSSSIVKVDNVDAKNPDAADKFDIKADSTTSATYDKSVSFFNPSFIIGGGVQYDLFSNTKVYTGLRYNGGLVDMLSEDKWTATNSFTSLSFGIIF
ncbi:MAG: porin family protein [Bacteroidetes bacterium]|nr:porin family protein [Bacteroidota bacterium]